MRIALLLPILLSAVTAASQPNFDRNYCGFAPNDSIDLTNDGIPDLVVLGFRSGTDDEPSSSGNCYLHVMNLPGTSFLNSRDEQGRWRLKVYNKGDSIRAVSTRPQDDLQIPLVNYTDGSIPVAYWGYGGHAEPFIVTSELGTQHYVFLIKGKEQDRHGSFTIEPPVRSDRVNIHVGVLMPTDQPFTVR
ncbi:MAG: hypothetical protein JNN32_11940 [Flavobacteriales bacterium]|nr:hypothetical protein [Flavobacteriales bacterium]